MYVAMALVRRLTLNGEDVLGELISMILAYFFLNRNLTYRYCFNKHSFLNLVDGNAR